MSQQICEQQKNFYTRQTEIRHVKGKDIYALATILDLSSSTSHGKKLMEIVPKSNGSKELQFEPIHIRQIENAANLSMGTSLFTEIFLEEWGTMGRKGERPTVGLLLQLLIEGELWQGADYVAQHFLNEKPPARPSGGPAARVNTSFSSEDFKDINSLIFDSATYPTSTELYDAIVVTQNLLDNNRDCFDKYKSMEKLSLGEEVRISTNMLDEINAEFTHAGAKMQNMTVTISTENTFSDVTNTSNVLREASVSSATNADMQSEDINSTEHVSVVSNSLPLLSGLNANL